MKFFTREWATGELSDDDFEVAPDRYAHHVEQLQPPDDLRQLAATDLHDALVESVRAAPDGHLSIDLVTGDLQRGYFTTTLTYSDAVAWGATITYLQVAASKRDVEVFADEIDRSGGTWLHRILFSDFEEVVIHFSRVAVRQTCRDSRELNGR